MMTPRQNMLISTKRIGKNFWKYYKYLIVLTLIASIGSILSVGIDGWFYSETDYTLGSLRAQYMDQLIMSAEEFALTYPDAVWISEQMFKSAMVIDGLVTLVQMIGNFVGMAFVVMPMAYVFYEVAAGRAVDLKSALKYSVKGIPLFLLISLKVFLWSLLFIIPGIVKAIAYSMSYFVKLENPEMSANECIKRSCEITNGRKGAYFVLMLNFLFRFFVAALVSSVAITFTEVVLSTVFSNALTVAVILSLLISVALEIATSVFVEVRWRTSEAVFYVDAKRSWLEEVEVDLRFNHESGGEYYDPYSGSTVTDCDVGDGANPFGEKDDSVKKDNDGKIDPFE